MELISFPDRQTLDEAKSRHPEFMRPNVVPYAVVFPGGLSGEECDLIQKNLGVLEPYRVRGCGGVTRETSSDPSLEPIEVVARAINDLYFGFDLDPGQHSWMQTYLREHKYKLHMDGSPGQMRKLTAVAMLSDPEDYEGGALSLHVHPRRFVVPRQRGTIAVFQHWVLHDVSPILSGKRQTINMGFWGPPFK